MTTPIVDLRVARDSIVLERTITTNPDPVLALDSFGADAWAPHTTLRASESDFSQLEPSLSTALGVKRFDRIETENGNSLHHVECHLGDGGPMGVLADEEVRLHHAATQNGSWDLLIKFLSPEVCDTFIQTTGEQDYGPSATDTPRCHRHLERS